MQCLERFVISSKGYFIIFNKRQSYRVLQRCFKRVSELFNQCVDVIDSRMHSINQTIHGRVDVEQIIEEASSFSIITLPSVTNQSRQTVLFENPLISDDEAQVPPEIHLRQFPQNAVINGPTEPQLFLPPIAHQSIRFAPTHKPEGSPSLLFPKTIAQDPKKKTEEPTPAAPSCKFKTRRGIV